MSNDLWRWADPNGQQRTVRLDELRASIAGGLIAPNTPVWKPGWTAWQPAHDVPELSTSAVSAANGVVPNIPPPPLAVVAVQHAWEAKAAESFRPPPIARGARPDEPPPPPPYVPVSGKAPSLPPGLSPQMGSSVRTSIGLPPPPELVALAAARAADAAKANAPDPRIEELSGSVLLDERGGPNGAMPAPTDPRPYDQGSVPPFGTIPPDDSLEIPVRNPLKSLLSDLEALRAGRPPKNKKRLIAAGVIVAAAALLFVALVISVIGSIASSSSSSASASASASGATSASPPSSATSSAGAAGAAPGSAGAATPTPPKDESKGSPGLGDCTLAGEPKTLGWRAVIATGIEAAPASGALALGFATSARDGIALTLDPVSLAVTGTAKVRSGGGDVRRVTPLVTQGKLAVVADGDRRGDKLAGRRTVAASPPIDVGVAEGGLAWAPHGKDSWAKLFALDGDGPVEALRAIPLATDKGIAVAFRRGNAIWVGVAKGEGALKEAGLQALPGLGQVGSPAIATSGESLVVAWADRASAQDPWQIRWTKMPVGGAAPAPATLPMPEGGLGSQAMSPALAGLGNGRFLVAWTEGPVSNHQVRAMTMGFDGAPSGAALAVSPQGLNAGQPSAAVGPDGRGVVAFLAGKGKGYELYVAPVTCAPR